MDLAAIKSIIIEVLKKYPIKRAAVFGSFARGEQSDESDIDVLVETSRTITLFDFLKINHDLEDTLHRKVDLVEYSAIKPSIKDRVLKDAIIIL